MSLTITSATPLVQNLTTTVTTASFTPVAGSVLIAMGVGSSSASAATTSTITDSLGGVWTQRAHANKTAPGGTGDGGDTVISSRVIGIAPTAMTVTNTVTGTTPDGAGLQVFQVVPQGQIVFGATAVASPAVGPTFTASVTNIYSGSTILAAADNWNLATYTASSTDLSLFSFFSNGNIGGSFGYKVATAIGSQSSNFTSTDAGGLWYYALVEIADVQPPGIQTPGPPATTSSIFGLALPYFIDPLAGGDTGLPGVPIPIWQPAPVFRYAVKGLPRRRPTTPSPVPPQVVPIPPVTRRAVKGLYQRRPLNRRPVPPQDRIPLPVVRKAVKGVPRRRPADVTPVPPQDRIPLPVVRRALKGTPRRRPAAVTPVPPQAWPIPPVIRRAIKGLYQRRPLNRAIVPDQVIIPPPAYPPAPVTLRALRGMRRRIPTTSMPVPPQVFPPAFIPQTARRARAALLARRTRGDVTPPLDQSGPPSLPRSRRAGLPLTRRTRGDVTPPLDQATPVPATRARRAALPVRRRAPAVTVPGQAQSPWVQTASRRIIRTLRRARPTAPPIDQAAPIAARPAPKPGRLRLPRRPPITPVPPQVPPPWVPQRARRNSRWGVLARRGKVFPGKWIGLGNPFVPKPGRAEPGTRTGPAAEPGTRTTSSAEPGTRASAAPEPGTHRGPDAEPGTRTGPNAEPGGDT